MVQMDYQQLSEEQLQQLFIQGDGQAFFEFLRRYQPDVLGRWQRQYRLLYEKYTVEFEDFFDRLLREAILKWDRAKASFRTFFLLQVCRRRVIDFTRSLWKKYYGEAAVATGFGTPGGDDDDLGDILDRGHPPSCQDPPFPEQDIALLHKAVAFEEQDCQELLRLMSYSGVKTFEERAEVLATLGYTKKASSWRSTWMRNRQRIADYIKAARETP